MLRAERGIERRNLIELSRYSICYSEVLSTQLQRKAGLLFIIYYLLSGQPSTLIVAKTELFDKIYLSKTLLNMRNLKMMAFRFPVDRKHSFFENGAFQELTSP